ncbi:MAG: [FeFe] hydrogenase H-cluster radical SAM maturase HydE [Candidatus Omnitrophica bacterium]|nr:[FeFe] hydrogenase H-cluster radical SAM maturase HydE [Candidatus Omnitrophota bacterium]
MCYAIPGRVKGFDGKFVRVDYFGEEKKAINELLDLKEGDYIYAQGGFVLTRVPPREAEETLAAWKDMFFELQAVDQRASQLSPWGGSRHGKVRDLLNRALANGKLTHEEIKYLLEIKDGSERDFLLSAANHLRQKQHSNSCCVHGIVEISNHCAEGCEYCGISCLNRVLFRYRMSDEEILEAVRSAVEDHGFKALVLQSGEDAGRTVDELVDIIIEIKRRFGVLIFISFGELGPMALSRLYEAGARGLLLRFETSDSALFARIHPGSKLEDRLAELRHANELGYLIVTGSLIGLPGQTTETLARDLELAGELNVEMLSMGPFLPHPHTPMGKVPPPSVDQVIQMLAVARFALPAQVKILVTTGLETLAPEARRAGLMAGANSVMLNVTPQENRALYEIYPGRAHQDDAIDEQIAETLTLLKDLGRAPTDLSIGEK